MHSPHCLCSVVFNDFFIMKTNQRKKRLQRWNVHRHFQRAFRQHAHTAHRRREREDVEKEMSWAEEKTRKRGDLVNVRNRKTEIAKAQKSKGGKKEVDGGQRQVRMVMRRKTGREKEERVLQTSPRQAGIQAIIRVCNGRAYYGQSKCVCTCVCG